MKKIAQGKERINSLFVDNDNIYIARRTKIEIYNKNTHELMRTIEVAEKGVQICIDESHIYCTTNHNFVVYNKQNYEQLYKKQFGYDISSDLRRPINDANRVYFPIRNGTIIAVSKNDFNDFSEIKLHPQTVWGMCIDDNYLYTGCVDTLVRKVCKKDLSLVLEYKAHKKNVQRIAVTENKVYSTGSDLSIAIFNKHTGELVKQLKKVHNKAVNGLFIYDNYLISSSQADRMIKVYNLNNLELVKQHNFSVDEGGGIVITADRVYIALKNEQCLLVVSTTDFLG